MINEAQKDYFDNNITWIHDKAENLSLDKKYSLIVAGDSIHWMDWETIFPKFKRILSKEGYLVLVTRQEKTDWDALLLELIKRYSLIKNFKSIDLPNLLQINHYWKIIDEFSAKPIKYEINLEDYIQSFHSRTSLAINDMDKKERVKFDEGIREISLPFSKNKNITLSSISKMTWGIPL